MSLILTIPAVQTAIARHVAKNINDNTGVNIKIDKLQITLSGAIILKNFMALDTHQDTIFYAKRLQTYIRNPWSFNRDKALKLGQTEIDNLQGKIITYKGDKKSNLDIFVEKINGKPGNDKSEKPFAINIRKLLLNKSSFKLFDYNLKHPKILDFSRLHSELMDFKQVSDKVSFRLVHLQMLDYRGLQIKNISTDFKYNAHRIDFKNLKLQTPESSIAMTLNFISPVKNFQDFENIVQVEGNINEAVIATTDLNKFSDIFNDKRLLFIKTGISGTLNDLKLNGLHASTDNRIRIKGEVELKNIFNEQNIIIDSHLNQFAISLKKLHNLLPGVLTPKLVSTFEPFGDFEMTGDLLYGTENLKTDLEVLTNLGDLSLNLQMNNLTDMTKAAYQGHIVTENLKIKAFVKEPVDDLTTDFNIKGTGLTLNSLNANLIGSIDNITYNDYTYHNIEINGDFQNKLFEGQVDIADKNLEMDFNGLIDFSKTKRQLDFSMEVCYANLYNLNFSKDEFARVEGETELKAEWFDIEDIVGKLQAYNLKIVNQYNTYVFDDFSIESFFNEKQERQILFNSKDIVSGYIRGKFKFKSVPLLIQNALGSVFANYKLKHVDNQQYMFYKLLIHNKIVNLINPDVKIENNTLVKGKINSKNNQLNFKLLSKKITFAGNEFDNLNLNIENKNPLYNIFLKIDTINTGYYKFKKLRLLNTTINDTLYLKAKFEGGSQFKDHYDISFFYTMDQWQNFVFGLQNSILNCKNIPWKIDPEVNLNRIVYKPEADSLKIDDVGIFHKNERIGISGIKYKDSMDFAANLDSIDLTHITPQFKDFNFEGKINGQIHLTKYGINILPSAVLGIKNFKLNNHLLGDLSLKISALPGKHLFVDMSVLKDKIQTVKLLGYVDMKKQTPEMNANLLFNDFSVKPLENLFKETFSNIRGKLTGRVKLSGPVNNLSFDGKLYVNNFGMKILALNTDYQFENQSIVYLHDQTFELKNAHFIDTKYQTKATINGTVKHHNFDNWHLDLKIDTGNLLVLDTPKDPLEMFYGTVFTGGNARIYGSVNHLKIDAEMQTKPKTYLVITLTDYESFNENDFVRIVSKKDYKKEKQNIKKRHKVYEGLEMNFDLDITTDAQLEILLDQEFGSTLVAKGTGLVLMNINTNGQFNIFGDFAVEEGVYNFKYAGVIDKKFTVEPGSYISWEGDPYDATLDIKAVYETFADPTVLLTEQGLTAKKMPVQAIIYLKDKLIKPTISFDLKLPKANAVLRSQIDYILSDPDKKTLQVLSLLSFGDFINENDYNLSRRAGEGVVKTFTEKGLNILNGLMAQDDKFQVNLNYTSGNENIERNLVTDPQVGLSLVTQINKKVYINGKVAIPVGRYTKSSIVGDIELEVYLDKKGNLIFRVFNKQTELEYLGQQEGYTQGVGLSYQVDFDTFSDILRKFGIIVKKEP